MSTIAEMRSKAWSTSTLKGGIELCNRMQEAADYGIFDSIPDDLPEEEMLLQLEESSPI